MFALGLDKGDGLFISESSPEGELPNLFLGEHHCQNFAEPGPIGVKSSRPELAAPRYPDVGGDDNAKDLSARPLGTYNPPLNLPSSFTFPPRLEAGRLPPPS